MILKDIQRIQEFIEGEGIPLVISSTEFNSSYMGFDTITITYKGFYDKAYIAKRQKEELRKSLSRFPNNDKDE